MEEMYEVLKFIEHGANCRQSMDCVQGTILIDYLKDNPVIEKAVLLNWFRELAVSIDQYHRSHSRQEYRYLNPCSIVVTDGGELFLLDTETPDNESVMKRMQSRAVRNHFVKPVYELGVSRKNAVDLFAYGRTIQFILAYSEEYPALSGREERRLSRVIGRCTQETGKKYEDVCQVLKDLPTVPKPKYCSCKSGRIPGRKLVLAAGAAAGLGIGLCFGMNGENDTYNRDAPRTGETQSMSPYVTEQEDVPEKNLNEYSEFCCVKPVAEKAVLAGGNFMQICENRILINEMINVYGRVMELETDNQTIMKIGLKKMKIEMEQQNFEQALKTAKIISEKAGESEQLAELVETCETEPVKNP